MTTQRIDFHYEISDERLIAYSRIPLLDRLKWLDEVRRFTLAVRSAPVADKHKPTPKTAIRQDGLTLVELVIFIIVVGVALAGVLTVLNVTVKSSADPLIRKQMLSIAEALLEEVQMHQFTYCDPTDANAATASSPAGCATTPEALGPEGTQARLNSATPFNNVNDYYVATTGFTLSSPIADITNTSTAPAGYSAKIDIVAEPLGTIAPVDSTPANMKALRIAVTVCHAATCPSAGADSIVIESYRSRYSPNF